MRFNIAHHAPRRLPRVRVKLPVMPASRYADRIDAEPGLC